MLRVLKAVVKSHPVLLRVAIAVRSVFAPTTDDLLQRMVRKVDRCVDRPTFVKVGANDG